MPSGLAANLRCQQRHRRVVAGHLLQSIECTGADISQLLGHCANLHEGTGGPAESGLGFRRIENLHRLFNAGKFLGSQSGSGCPIIRLLTTRRLGVIEELFISLQLCTGILTILLRISFHRSGLGILSLLFVQGTLQVGELLVLGRHEVLKYLQVLGLGCTGSFQIGCECVEHILQNSYNLVRRWSVRIYTTDLRRSLSES
mmetsp:Transcript_32243/g.78720  ORF Transcript_32243/g.78720 Transcript_32243/m.78720 type:complete len:201 (+) Transcript_32243:1032-1634(+)